MAYCINCGKELPDGARFCTFCGTAQTTVKTEESVTEQETVVEQSVSEEQRKQDERETQAFPKSKEKTDNIVSPASTENVKKRPHVLWGIGLFVASIVALFLSSWVGLVIYSAVFVLSIFIIVKKGRLFGFAITALVISCIGIPWSVYEIVRDTKAKNQIEVVEEVEVEKKDIEATEEQDDNKIEREESEKKEKEPAYTEVEYAGIVFQVPKEFSSKGELDSGFDYYYDKSENNALIFAGLTDVGLPKNISEQDLQKAYDTVFDNQVDNSEYDLTLKDEKEYYIDGILCKERDYTFSQEGVTGVFRFAVIVNTDVDGVIIAGLFCKYEDDVEQYADVYDNMMKTAKRINGAGTDTMNRQNDSLDSGSGDGVDPDLKAYLDSYEAFVNEYVDFMKKYMDDPSNVVSMLDEYTDIMKRMEDFEKKINAYESEDLSAADMDYYLDVTTRCTKKMLEVYSN